MDKKYLAKKDALKAIKQSMGKESGKKMMGGGIAAKVIAKDPKSLLEGLKKAEEVVSEQEEMMNPEEGESSMHEEKEMGSLEDMSREELIDLVRELRGEED